MSQENVEIVRRHIEDRFAAPVDAAAG